MQVLKKLINTFSSEWRLICYTIKNFTLLHERFTKTSKNRFLSDEFANQLVQTVEQWLRSEFNESLMINNELAARSLSDYQKRQTDIENYKNPKKDVHHIFNSKIMVSFF